MNPCCRGTAFAIVLALTCHSNAQESDSVQSNASTLPLPLLDIDYPFDSVIDAEQGTVTLEVSVGANGTVTHVDVLDASAPDRLITAATEIAKRRFRPSVSNAAVAQTYRVQAVWSAPLQPATEYLLDYPVAGSEHQVQYPKPLNSHRVTGADYPDPAQQQGEPVITYLVRSDGTVGETVVVASSGYVSLDRAAVKVVNRWKFAPGLVDGAPSEFWLMVEMPFAYSAKGPLQPVRFCHDRPLLAPDAPYRNGGATRSIVRWMSVDISDGKVQDAIILTRNGWMRVSKPLAALFSIPRNFPQIRMSANTSNCWVEVAEPRKTRS